MTKEMSESAPPNPFRHGQETDKPQIPRPSVLSDEERADVHALRASRRAQQAAVSAGPIHISPEPPRAPIRAIASRAVHKAQEGLAGLKQSAQSRWGSLREPEPEQEELGVLDVTVPSSQPETEDIPPIETSDELLGRLLTELEVLKDQYYEKLSPRQAAIELARKLGLGGNTDEERIAKIRAAYSQALDHASDEAFDRFEKGLQNKRLDRLWIPSAQFLLKESQTASEVGPGLDLTLPAPTKSDLAPAQRPGESDGTLEYHRAEYPEFHLIFDILDEGFGPEFNDLDTPAVWAYLKRLDPSLTKQAVYAQLLYDLQRMTPEEFKDARPFMLVRGFSTEAL